MTRTAYEWFGREKMSFYEYLDPIGWKMDLHFPCKLGRKGSSTLLICMENNNMTRCARTREVNQLCLTSMVREGELLDLEIDWGDVAEYP